MAKWGEGDPRWIVEERADAINVNNWHWTEKNATPWSKDKIKKLLEGLVLEDSECHVKVTEVTSIEGEASASNRKGKLFFFYEWEIKADWQGYLKSDSTREKHKGDLLIPNLSEEHPVADVDINIALKESAKKEAFKVKEYVRKEGLTAIRKRLQIYIDELKQNFCQGMILPTKNGSQAQVNAQKQQMTQSERREFREGVVVAGEGLGAGQVPVREYHEDVEFKCTADEVYSVFLDKHKLQAFTHGPVEVEAKVGGKFELFGGNIFGVISGLVANESLQMQWRFKSWPSDHFSDVSLLFRQKENCTVVSLKQTGIPASDYERTVEGWKNYYWGSIKNTFGFGALLF